MRLLFVTLAAGLCAGQGTGLLMVDASTTTAVTHGSGASMQNLIPATTLMWVKPTGASTSANLAVMLCKCASAGPLWAIQGTNTNLQMSRQYASALSRGRVALGNTNWTVGAWNFLATTEDGVTFPKIYTGLLGVPAVAVVTYASTTDPAGALTTDAGNTMTIGGNAGLTQGFPGAIALVAYCNTGFSLGQIISWQFQPRMMAGCKLFAVYSGTGTQVDYSGNGNSGTVTAATATSGPPLAPLWGH